MRMRARPCPSPVFFDAWMHAIAARVSLVLQCRKLGRRFLKYRSSACAKPRCKRRVAGLHYIGVNACILGLIRIDALQRSECPKFGGAFGAVALNLIGQREAAARASDT